MTSRSVRTGLSLGTISLIMVAQAAVAMLTSLWLAQATIDVTFAYIGLGSSSALDFAYVVAPNFPTAIVAVCLTFVAASVLGFTGWGLAIAAVVSNSGRTQGLVAIAIGIVAPLASVGYLWFAWTDLLTRLSP